MGRPEQAGSEFFGWWRAGLYTVGLAYRLFFRVRFYRLDRLPATGPALIACNHISVLDPVALALATSARGRIVRFLAAVEAFDTPLIGWGLWRTRQIPLRRGAGDRRAMGEAAAVIRSGGLAGIFPEGRVGGGPGLLPGRKGAARVALAAGVPVVPMAVWGTHVRWPRSGLTWRRPWRPRVAVVLGEPIAAEGDPGDPRLVRDLTLRIMREIDELLALAKRRSSEPREP